MSTIVPSRAAAYAASTGLPTNFKSHALLRGIALDQIDRKVGARPFAPVARHATGRASFQLPAFAEGCHCGLARGLLTCRYAAGGGGGGLGGLGGVARPHLPDHCKFFELFWLANKEIKETKTMDGPK
jgi:hypothetical protein